MWYKQQMKHLSREYLENFTFTVLLPYTSLLRLQVREVGTVPRISSLHCTAMTAQIGSLGVQGPPNHPDLQTGTKHPKDQRKIRKVLLSPHVMKLIPVLLLVVKNGSHQQETSMYMNRSSYFAKIPSC